jgi:GT2 family glycosyltransferase
MQGAIRLLQEHFRRRPAQGFSHWDCRATSHGFNPLWARQELIGIFKKLADRYTYEIIIADNASTDRTPQILREIAAQDKNFKVIFNSRNFGVNRSGNNAFRQACGDAGHG